MRQFLWPCVVLLLGCESIYSDNPHNCVQNPNACSDTERCNPTTLRCETLDCTINTTLCSPSDICDPMTLRCRPVTFVLGQPDDKTNVNAAYGQSSPQAALLLPPVSGATKVAIGDTGNHRILIWNSVPTKNRPADAVLGMPDIHTLTDSGAYGGTTESSTEQPWSLATTSSKLIVGDQALHRVLFWDSIPTVMPVGGPIAASNLWGQSNYEKGAANSGGSVSASGVYNPKIFVEPGGSAGSDFFISDAVNNRVLIFENGLPGNPTKVFGQTSFAASSANTSRTTLNGPRGLAMSGPGAALMIADTNNNRIVGSGPGQWITTATPFNLLVGQANFNAGAANRGGVASPVTLSAPDGICYCQANFFVADSGNNRVLVFNRPTAFNPTNPPFPVESAVVVLGQPGFASIGPNRGNAAPDAGTMNSPSDVSCDGTRLLVADTGNHRTLIWNNAFTGTTLNLKNGQNADVVLGQPDETSAVVNNPAPDGLLHFNGPTDVATDGTRLAVADTGNHRVLLWLTLPRNGSSKPDVVLGQPGFASNQANSGGLTASSLNSPAGVTLDGGRLAVSDTENNRVLIWNSIPLTSNMPADLVLGQPDFVTADPGSDAAGLLFAHPYGLVLSQSVLYVTDAGRNRALVYKKLASGNPPADVVIGMPTGSPRSASSLADPRGIAISQNKLFIADRGNQRVLVWNRIPSSSAQPADVVIGQNDFTSAYTKIGRSNLNQPRDVLVLGERLFVSASAENRIQYWNHLPTENGTNPDGVLGQVDFFSALPNAPDIKPLERLSSPAGLAVAGDQLYIADTLNNRLVVRALPSL